MLKDRLKNLRLSKGLTLQQVGDHFGISAASVANWENGKSQPDSRKLSRLSELLGSNLAFLLEGQNSETPASEELFFPSVPFISWDQISKQLPPNPTSQFASPLHSKLSSLGFATRYPGSTELNWSQGPIPGGSLIFIDPNKELSSDCLVLIQDQSSKLMFARLQKKSNQINYLLKNIDTFEFIYDSKEVKILGRIVEWRLSAAI